MSDRSWQDQIVSERMTVDQEFTERVQESEFTSQEWSLIMTAVELELEGSGEDAHIVANTSKVEQIIPELKNMGSQMSAMSGGQSSGGFLSSILSTLGLGGDSDRAKLEAATTLADEYAATLQAHLEENGKWERVRD